MHTTSTLAGCEQARNLTSFGEDFTFIVDFQPAL
jgi:hypothetical protein